MKGCIFQAEMKKAGNVVSTNLCPHFAMSRADLFNVVKSVSMHPAHLVTYSDSMRISHFIQVQAA